MAFTLEPAPPPLEELAGLEAPEEAPVLAFETWMTAAVGKLFFRPPRAFSASPALLWVDARVDQVAARGEAAEVF